jgi:acetate kinase
MSQASQIRILAINSGSSSLKVALYEIDKTEKLNVAIRVRRIGIPGGRIRASDAQGETLLDREVNLPDHVAALSAVLQWLGHEKHEILAVGHRVVHGGPHYSEPQVITEAVMSALRELTPIDPDHMPQAISAIETVKREHPSLMQAACFDTAFHRHMPLVAQVCPLPSQFYDDGVLRYGFHGLSYEYVISELRRLDGELADGRVVIAHLGNGASMAALHQGHSVDTSMGFTPTAGLLMGTRSGDIDPGVLLYLLEEKKMSAKEVNHLLNKDSGLLGISGISEDMQDLIEHADDNCRAGLAVELFCFRAKKCLGAYAALLGGLDVVVFTAGIGEHAPEVRERICSGLQFMGLQLDPARNRETAPVISAKTSQVKVRVIKTNEELMIARHTARLMGSQRN